MEAVTFNIKDGYLGAQPVLVWWTLSTSAQALPAGSTTTLTLAEAYIHAEAIPF